MQTQEWRSEYAPLVSILQEKLGNKRTCVDVVCEYEEAMRSIWAFTAQLLGDAGTSAVLTRSLRLATPNAPLLLNVQVHGQEVDFGNLRARAEEPDCDMTEVIDAMLRLAVVMFGTLTDLTGNTVTALLLDRLGRTTEK